MKRWLASLAAAALLAPLGASALDNGFNDDNWAEDDFGYYDEDFAWESGDASFDDWYADADNDWSSFYDDIGDEGVFDV